MAIGFDCGTYNLVACNRNEKGDFVYKREINAFLEIPLEYKFVFNMMKKSGVPMILREDKSVAYALGEAAIEMAYTMPQIDLRRPMTIWGLTPFGPKFGCPGNWGWTCSPPRSTKASTNNRILT
jgi:hypothetical protein